MSSHIVLWSEKMLDVISIFLNLLRFDLRPKMWSIPEIVPCAFENKVYPTAFENKVYPTAFGWNILKISMRSISSNVSFKTCVSLWILSFDDWLIGVSGVLMSISPFMSVSLFLCIEVLLCWMHRYLQLLCLPLGLIPWSLCSVLPYLLESSLF